MFELRLLKATAHIEALVILQLPGVIVGQRTGAVAAHIEALRQHIVAAGRLKVTARRTMAVVQHTVVIRQQVAADKVAK